MLEKDFARSEAENLQKFEKGNYLVSASNAAWRR